MWQFESKEVCDCLCFHSQLDCTGWQKPVVWDSLCGAVAARPPVIEGAAFLWDFAVCSYIGGSNCRLLGALAGEFRGCGKESHARHLMGNATATAPHTASHTTSFRHPVHSDWLWKHRHSHTSLLPNCHIVPRLPRSLLSNLHNIPRLPRDWAIQVASPNNMPRIASLSATSELSCQCVWHSAARLRRVPCVIEGTAFLWNFGVCVYIGGSNCKSLDTLSEEFRGCGQKAMRGIFLGNATAECQTHWLESSEVAEREAMRGILFGDATAEC